MPFGYNGKILNVDISTKNIFVEEKAESWYRKYLGGRGIGGYYLLNELKPGIDPLSAENILIFAASVVTGVPFPGNGRASVVAKSPLTGGFGESEAGGFWGPRLKFAGFDAVVFKGASEKPIYVYIHDGIVEMKDATELWGLTTREADRRIAEELKAPDLAMATIGPAGENLVRYACITAGANNVFGRMGIGAVMGSKKIKSVVVSGKNNLEIKDLSRIKEINKWFGDHFKDPDKNKVFFDMGTAIGINMYNEVGSLPYKNFQGGTIENGDKLSGEFMQENGYMVGKATCYACPVACRKTAIVEGHGKLDTNGIVHSPEYETLGALGSNCGITDVKAVIKAAQLCDEYGLDTISAGVTISFVMECVEKGILDKDILGIDVDANFGMTDAVLRSLDMITNRDGFGDLMAEGVKRLAEKIGADAQDIAVHSKGEELAVQDPRGGKVGAAIGYAVSHNGGDHINMEHDFQFNQEGPFLKSLNPLGIIEPVATMDLGFNKVKLFVINQKLWGLYHMLDICIFIPAPGHTMTLPDLNDIINSSTGWDTSLYELMEAGERGIVMTRLFNQREGFTAEHDTIPKRMTEPLINGKAKGSKVDISDMNKAIKYYYEMMGWNAEDGMPTKGKILQLGLGEFI
jgi:aldehyde:ferredoxin oxidoreductase